MTNSKTFIRALSLLLIANSAHAGWFDLGAGAVAGFLMGRATGGSSGGSGGGDVTIVNQSYVDMTPVAEAIRASGHEIAESIRRQPDHFYSAEDQKMFNEHYRLDRYGKAIGIDLGSASIRKLVLDRGKTELQNQLENKLANLQLDVLLSANIARAFRGQSALQAMDLEKGGESASPFRANALLNIVDWSRQHPGAAVPQNLLDEPLFEDSVRGSVTRAEELSTAKLIAALGGEAAKNARGFGKTSYQDLLQSNASRVRALNNAGDWHTLFSTALGQRANRIDALVTYCSEKLPGETRAAEAYLKKAHLYVSSAEKSGFSDHRPLGELVREANAKSRLDDLYSERLNRGLAASVKAGISAWATRCNLARSEAQGVQAITKVQVLLASEALQAEYASRTRSPANRSVAGGESKGVDSTSLFEVTPTEVAAPTASQAR